MGLRPLDESHMFCNPHMLCKSHIWCNPVTWDVLLVNIYAPNRLAERETFFPSWWNGRVQAELFSLRKILFLYEVLNWTAWVASVLEVQNVLS